MRAGAVKQLAMDSRRGACPPLKAGQAPRSPSACAAVFAGDLERGLIPRQGSDMNVPPDKRRALAASRAKEIAGHDAEVARLEARVKGLEEVNAALGRATGLLHQMSEQEPDATPTPNPLHVERDLECHDDRATHVTAVSSATSAFSAVRKPADRAARRSGEDPSPAWKW